MSYQLTVVVLTYNYGRYLPYCLDSILGQDFTDFELLIFDNGSSDGTPDVVAAYLDDPRVRYTRHAINMSAGFNWNLGIRSGSGRYFTLISADDFILPGHLGKLVNLLKNNPDCVMAYVPITRVDDNNQPIVTAQHLAHRKFSTAGGYDEYVELLALGNYASFSACMYDRQQIGRDFVLEVDALGVCDHELNIRLAAKYHNFAYDPVSSACYRIHAAQHTQTEFYKTPEALFGHMFLLEQHLDCLSPLQVASHRRALAHQITIYAPNFNYWGLHADERARFDVLVQRVQTGRDAWLESGVPGRISILLPYSMESSALLDFMTSLDLQSYADWECVMTHDGSREQLAALACALQSVATPWRFRLLRCASGNLAELLNAAAMQASGEFFIAADGSQVWPCDYLGQLAQLLSADARADISALLPASAIAYFFSQTLAYPDLFDRNPLPGGALYRRRVFPKASRYDPVFCGDDVAWAFWIDAIKRGCQIVLGSASGWPTSTAVAATSPLTLALIRFVNLDQMPIDILEHIYQTLIENRQVWQAQIEQLSASRRSYASAIALNYVARSLDLAASKQPNAGTWTALPTTENTYLHWLFSQRLTASSPQLLQSWRQAILQWRHRPTMTVVVVDQDGAAAMVERSVRSLQTQSYPCDSIVVLSAKPDHGLHSSVQWHTFGGTWIAAFNTLTQHVKSDWLYLLHAGDFLEPDALALVADASNSYPELAYLYTDQDCCGIDGTASEPIFKPALNLDLLRSLPYTGRSVVMSRTVLLALGGLNEAFGEITCVDFLLRVIEQGNVGVIAHLDHMLCHAAVALSSWCAREENAAAMRRAVSEHLLRLGLTAQVTSADNGVQRVHYPLPLPPQISVIIAAAGLLQDLQRCVASVLTKTAYRPFEVLLVPASRDCCHAQELNRYLEQVAAQDSRIRLLMPLSADNASVAAAANAAALQANGEYVLFMGAATAVLQIEWLELLVQHAARQEVGLVGCKMINRAKKIVHAGAVVGLNGCVGTVFGAEDMAANGPMLRLQADQNYSVVSGDCMMVRQSLFEDIGGFDTQYENAELRSADLCLRIREAGFLVVWTPYPVLLLENNENTDSGAPLARMAQEEQVFYRRWWHIIGQDPAYNRNLSLQGRGFEMVGSATPPVLPQRSKILLWTSCAADDGALYPFRQLQQAGLLENIVVSSGLPILPELARLQPVCLIIVGPFDTARAQALSNLHQVLPMRVMHAPIQAPTVEEASVLSQYGHLLALTLVRCADLASAYQRCGQVVQLIDGDLSLIDSDSIVTPVSARSSQRLRLGLQGDVDQAALTLMAQLFEQLGERLGNSVEFIVAARRFPLLLQPYITEYHQLSALTPTPPLLSLIDVALVPLDARQQDYSYIMSCGAAGVAVIAGRAHALPVREAGVHLESWLNAVHRYISLEDNPVSDGVLLRRAVSARQERNLRHLEQWRLLLCNTDAGAAWPYEIASSSGSASAVVV